MSAMGGDELCQLRFDQLVVETAHARRVEHPCGKVHADEQASVLPNQCSTQACSAACVERRPLAAAGVRDARNSGSDEFWRPIRQLSELGVEAGGEAVERLLDVCIRRPARYVLS